MNFAAVEVEYYDDFDKETKKDYIICCGDSYEEVGRNLEDFYGNDIVSIKITLLEEGPVYLTQDILDSVVRGEYNGEYD